MCLEILDELLAGFVQAQTRPELAVLLFGDTAAGIHAYSNNTRLNRVDALRESYPTVHQLVGEDFFHGMARLFSSTPSKDGDLNHYHPDFAEFIVAFEPARSLPYLADCARLDWHCHMAYYAPDALVFDFEKLGAISASGDALQFILHPSVRLIASPWPIYTIWAAHYRDGGFPESLDMPECAVTWRTPRNTVEVQLLTPAGFAMLSAIQSKQHFAHAAEAAFQLDPEHDIQISLSGWICAGVITDVCGVPNQ